MKNILLHTVPVLCLAVGAIFGIDAKETSVIQQALTTLIGVAFTVSPIVINFINSKKAKDAKKLSGK